MVSRFIISALFACACAALPSAGSAETTAVRVVRSAGSCPATIAVVIATKQFEGGSTTDMTARTMTAAFTAVLISATRKQIVFDAALRPAYASCEGKGTSADGMHAFALHRGRLGYTITLARGPEAEYDALLDVGVVGGLPHATVAFAD